METEISVHPLLSVLGQHIQSVFDLLFALLEAVPCLLYTSFAGFQIARLMQGCGKVNARLAG